MISLEAAVLHGGAANSPQGSFPCYPSRSSNLTKVRSQHIPRGLLQSQREGEKIYTAKRTIQLC